MKKIFLGIAVSVLCLSGTVWGKNLPNVKILAVGGTIAGVASTQEQSTSYKAGQLTVQTLIESVPAMKKLARITGEQYCNIGSGNLTDNDILGLAKRVDSVLKAPETDAVVITHGTDTLEETAWLLNLTVHSDKPIVLVGAMRPATAISADGPANLLNAVRCAASEEAIGQGALIVMNEEIHNARDVTKTDTTLVSAFQSPTLGAVGRIAAGSPVFFKKTLRKHTADSEFDLSRIKELPKVAIVYCHVGEDATMARAAVSSGAKGIIVAGTGNGTVSKHIFPTMEEAVKNGVPVVRSSRVPGGCVTTSKPSWDAAGFVRAGTLNPQKARILLQLALTKTSDGNEIQKIFDRY